MTLDEITVKVNVVADGVDEVLGGVADSVRGFAQTINGAQKSASAGYAAITAAAGTAFSIVKGAVQTGIDANNAYIAATKGLESVAMANGVGSKEMQTALSGVTDAFFSAGDAATAYKNLLGRGYTLDQATATITRLKDAAAFGRQSSYSLSQAVVSATEGLKNENSILVDNAGVTKNVAKMWEDYAKSIGVSTQSLTQAQKIEAEYQGIMQETQAQVGDLAKASDTLAGSQAEASNQSMLAAQSFGAAMAPSVQAGTEMVTGFMSAIQSAMGALPGLTSGLTTAAAAFTGITAATGAISTIKSLVAGASAFSAMLGPIGWVAAGLGVVAGAYTAVKTAQEKSPKRKKRGCKPAGKP